VEVSRPASVADLAVLDRLTAGAIDEQRPTRGGELLARRDSRPRPARPWLAEAIDDPDQLVLVGCIDLGPTSGAVPVGYAVGRVEVLRDGGRLAVVDELYVEPDAREVAVGEALMDDLLAWATAQGCFGIDALALPGNRATKNFFERYGLTARAIIVHKRLGDDAS
jgi:ribosomal protein S18 acetylase RimI-like enzyme